MSKADRFDNSDDFDIARRFLDAGVAIPSERARGAYAAARRLLEATHWLRRSREATDEPAQVFHCAPNRETNS